MGDQKVASDTAIKPAGPKQHGVGFMELIQYHVD